MLAPVLRSFGVIPTEEEADFPWILNGVGAECEVVKKHLAVARRPPDLVLIDKHKAGAVAGDHASLTLPCSFAQFQLALDKTAQIGCVGSRPRHRLNRSLLRSARRHGTAAQPFSPFSSRGRPSRCQGKPLPRSRIFLHFRGARSGVAAS